MKIFLTASPSRRAERRHKQLKDKGIDVNLATLEKELTNRDYYDSARKSPLKLSEDSVIIDSTDLDVEQVSLLIEKSWETYWKISKVGDALKYSRQCFNQEFKPKIWEVS